MRYAYTKALLKFFVFLFLLPLVQDILFSLSGSFNLSFPFQFVSSGGLFEIVPIDDGDSLFVRFNLGGCAILTLRRFSLTTGHTQTLSPPVLECFCDGPAYYPLSEKYLLRYLSGKYSLMDRKTREAVTALTSIGSVCPVYLYGNRLLLSKDEDQESEMISSEAITEVQTLDFQQTSQTKSSPGMILRGQPNGPFAVLQFRRNPSGILYLNLETMYTVKPVYRGEFPSLDCSLITSYGHHTTGRKLERYQCKFSHISSRRWRTSTIRDRRCTLAITRWQS
jgi:hypothetical protein